MHLVLDDGNISDGDIRYCIEHACCREHATIGVGIMCLTLTQRRKLLRNWSKPAPKNLKPWEYWAKKVNEHMFPINPEPYFDRILKVLRS